jgi:phosphomannomutase/phosphoglucomutase
MMQINNSFMINPHIFRAYDIRGIAHLPKSDKSVDLNPETMLLIGKGVGTYLKRHSGPNLVLGYDCRVSADELTQAFIEGALSTGCSITNIGMVPTPMLYFASCYYGFDGGVAITASHNPKEYNGVKIVGKDAHSVCGADLQDVLKLIQTQDFETGQGELKHMSVFEDYVSTLANLVHLERPLKVVVDAGNGAAGPYIRSFFETLGCEVVALYEEPDGNFPNHPANPEEIENMQDLIAAVQDHHADLGIGFDGDADRVGIVDEDGHHYSADLLLLLLSRELLSRKPGSKIVFDVKVSQILIRDIEANGGIPVMTKTGHSFIEKQMREVGAPLAGEISGHMFFAENYYGFDDAFLAAAKILEILSRTDKPFSSLLNNLTVSVCTPELKSSCPDDKKFAIVDQITKNLAEQFECITIDGVRVVFDENSWGAVRCSNTSPNLTIRFEAPDAKRLKEIMALMLLELKKYPQIDLWWETETFS